MCDFNSWIYIHIMCMHTCMQRCVCEHARSHTPVKDMHTVQQGCSPGWEKRRRWQLTAAFVFVPYDTLPTTARWHADPGGVGSQVITGSVCGL